MQCLFDVIDIWKIVDILLSIDEFNVIARSRSIIII